MKRELTVKENHIFRRAYRKGRTAVRGGFVVYCLRSKREKSRLGLTVSTKIGKAVIRNFTRRRLRELWRRYYGAMTERCDVIIVARSRAVTMPFSQLEQQYVSALRELRLLPEENDT